MAELNERLEIQAKAANMTVANELGANMIGGTTRPSQLARPAGPERTGHGAEAYSSEEKGAADIKDFGGGKKGT